jgi:phosphohistidine swiveling domain-containing protein
MPEQQEYGVFDQEVRSDCTWTRVNVGEAMPGVPAPLTWTWCGVASNEFLFRAWIELGVFPRSILCQAETGAERFVTIMKGRPVINLDLMRAVGDRIPGNSGNSVEASIFGTSREGVESRSVRSRYPFVCVKLPLATWQSRRKILAAVSLTREWWLQHTAGNRNMSPDEARDLLLESRRRYVSVGTSHCIARLFGQGLYVKVMAFCEQRGLGEEASALLASYGDTEEAETVDDLWALSREQMTMEEFLALHGYHAPVQGELAVPSWRVDSAPVMRLAESYAKRPDAESPSIKRAALRAARDELEHTLLGSLPLGRRLFLETLLKLARYYMPLAEVGRMIFLQLYDVARAASQVLGAELVQRGRLAEAADVYYLTVEELTGDLPSDSRQRVSKRRQLRGFYARHTIPELFTDQPDLLPLDAAPNIERLEGVPGSPGTVEGLARVVLDPDDSTGLHAGEILVCETTNPSWASFFFLAGGVVIDIGGALSHGAIVAREMGIPAVLNVRTGTKVIKTGDRLRVDGAAGTVEILERASGHEHLHVEETTEDDGTESATTQAGPMP